MSTCAIIGAAGRKKHMLSAVARPPLRPSHVSSARLSHSPHRPFASGRGVLTSDADMSSQTGFSCSDGQLFSAYLRGRVHILNCRLEHMLFWKRPLLESVISSSSSETLHSASPVMESSRTEAVWSLFCGVCTRVAAECVCHCDGRLLFVLCSCMCVC